jgi:hypothetical protein
MKRRDKHPSITPLRALAMLRRLCCERRESQQIPGFNYTRVHLPASLATDIELMLSDHVAHSISRRR